MRDIFLVAFFAVGTFLVNGTAAQHEGHTTPPADKSAAAPTRNEMKDGMMAQQAEVATLVDQIVKGFAAIENENDSAALKSKLAEHGKLVKELQAKIQEHSKMMQHMHRMMMTQPETK